jgi:hypothetical protein
MRDSIPGGTATSAFSIGFVKDHRDMRSSVALPPGTVVRIDENLFAYRYQIYGVCRRNSIAISAQDLHL